MKSKDNFRTTKHEGDTLGERDSREKVTPKKAPSREDDRESQNTPPENEVYVNLEPDELHLSEEEHPVKVGEKKNKKS